MEEHAAAVLKQETKEWRMESCKNHLYMIASQETQEVGIREAAVR